MIFDRVFFKFILAGLINTLAGSALMFLLYNVAGTGYWVSSAASYIAGSVLSFFLNKYFTFNVRRWSAFMVAAFAVNIAVCYLAVYGAAKPAVNYFLQNIPQKTRENIALFIGMVLFTGLNYLGQRFIVFRT
ncbi:MAG: GtrA family protein [Treponema sp.]|jgi:putative flippase GtrA|nr:GtrA family protein [Treponema sp.]